MPRSAYEKKGFVDSDGRYDPNFHTCALIDADRNTTLMQGEYLYGQIVQIENMPRVYSFNTPLDISVFTEGVLEPLITLDCDSGNVPLSHTGALNPTTNFIVSRDAVVYVGCDDDMVLHVPKKCLVFRLTCGPSVQSSVIIVWNLDGGYTPTIEELTERTSE